MKLLFLLSLFSFPIFSNAEVYLDNYGVGYGILSSGVLTEAVTENGESSIYGSFSLHFLDANISWAQDNLNLRYHIKAAYTLLPRKTEDGAADITKWRASFLLGYEPKKRNRKRFILTSGIGFFGIVSKGRGGTQVLNNGGGTTTFYRPSDTSHTKLLMLELGLTHQISREFSYSVEALVNGLFGDRRNLNIYMSLNYYWDRGYKRSLKKAREAEVNQNIDEFQAGEALVKKKRKKKKRKKRKKRRKKKSKKGEEGV